MGGEAREGLGYDVEVQEAGPDCWPGYTSWSAVILAAAKVWWGFGPPGNDLGMVQELSEIGNNTLEIW